MTISQITIAVYGDIFRVYHLGIVVDAASNLREGDYPLSRLAEFEAECQRRGYTHMGGNAELWWYQKVAGDAVLVEKVDS